MLRSHYSAILLLGISAGLMIFVGGDQLWPSLAQAQKYPGSAQRIVCPNQNYRPATKDFTLLRRAGLWHMIGINECEVSDPTKPDGQNHLGLMHSTSPDLLNWTDVGRVVLPGPDGAWDSTDTWAPSIVESDGTYYMFYAGVDWVNNYYRQRIGLATSTDLTTWTKSDANPVFDCSTLTWNYWNTETVDNYRYFGRDCRDPFVIRDQENNRWVMFYNARSKHIDQDPVREIEYPTIVGVATSTDLVNWTDAGSVFATAGYKSESPHVFKHDNTWYLVWTGDCGWRSPKCLKYATSSELLTGYSGFNDLPEIANLSVDENKYIFASEYYNDNGREYLAVVDGNPSTRSFYAMSWPDNALTISSVQYSAIGGRAWYDANHDGQLTENEARINGASMDLYLDNGDRLFNQSTDVLYKTVATSFSSITGGVKQQGFYNISTVLPGSYWVAASPGSYATGETLAGFLPTNGANTPLITVDSGQQNLVNDLGFSAPYDKTPPAKIVDLVAQ